MVPRLWIDVEDLFEYARGNPRPSGIQRLAFEMYQDLQSRHGATGLVRFVRHDPVHNSFAPVAWSDIARLFAALTRAPDTAPGSKPSEARPIAAAPEAPTAAAVPVPTLIAPITPHSRPRQLARRWVHRLPIALRDQAIRAIRSQVDALRACAALLGLIVLGLARAPIRFRARLAARRERRAAMHRFALDELAPPTDAARDRSRASRFADLVKPGDILLSLGSPWSHPDYGSLLARHRTKYGMRVAVLIYDLIPLRRPEWCDRGLVRLFRAWFEGTFPQCDALFAISRSTAEDIATYAQDHGFTLPGPVIPIPIGTGFSDPTEEACAVGHLPAPGSYALIVSTIEARKNHLLLFRVWRRMLEEMPREDVPTLVFAGRVGWLVDDLMRMIANTNLLDGRLVIIENPSDAELRALYRGCMFTMFPSFYEGWGLPVTESLALGKPCLIADRTSLPEAGGHLARRFDPDNLHDAYQVIRDTILDTDGLAAWEAQVKREFRPVLWSDTVDSLLRGLRHPLAPDGERAKQQDKKAVLF